MGRRLLLCAAASGSGKTTVTCALLRALTAAGERPTAFKSGPDYIDPMFHSRITGRPSHNLDLFLLGEAGARGLLSALGGPLAVIEGAMGCFDGIAMSDEASVYHLARTTATPAVLIADGRGQALSAAAVVKGVKEFRPDFPLRGVIFNRVSPMYYPRLKEAVERETGLKVYGFLPEQFDCGLESRHLGLVTAQEMAGLDQKLDLLGELARKYLDIPGLLALAGSAPALEAGPGLTLPPVEGRPRVAIARDEAFCFYYAAALRLLEALGAELAEFSPLTDTALPEGTAGLYLGGGYPELHARALAENTPMREAVRRAVQGGMPTVAECGGFLYLHRTLGDADGRCDWRMAEVFPAGAANTGKLSRFGYITMTAQCGGLLCGEGETLQGHEFHYWDSTAPGGDFSARKPRSERGWDCGYHTRTLYAGFPHLHFCGCPAAARRFLAAMQ